MTEDLDFLEAISLTTLKQIFLVTVGTFPVIPGVASNGSTVYVPSELSVDVTVVGGPLSGSTITVGVNPLQVVFNHNNTSAYVTNNTTTILVINTANGSVKTLGTATDTFGLARKGTTLFATGINNVFVINTNTNTVVHTIKVPRPPGQLFGLEFPALTPDGVFLYVPVRFNLVPFLTNENTVVVINTKTNKVVQTFTVGEEPLQVAAAANDIYGYVTNAFDGTVTVFQLAHLPPGL